MIKSFLQNKSQRTYSIDKSLLWVFKVSLVVVISLSTQYANARDFQIKQKDLCGFPDRYGKRHLVEFNGLAYFCYNNPDIGPEIHVSDGSQFGLRALGDFSGSNTGHPKILFKTDSHLYFVAQREESSEWTVWQTTGGAAKPRAIGQLSGSNGFRLSYVGEIEGRHILSNGSTVYVIDPIDRKVNMLEDGALGHVGFDFSETKIYKNHIYYMLFDRGSRAFNLMRSSVDGVKQEIKSIKTRGHVVLSEFTVNGKLILEHFPRKLDQYYELWLSDGTATFAGTEVASNNVFYTVGNLGEGLISLSDEGDQSFLNISNDLINFTQLFSFGDTNSFFFSEHDFVIKFGFIYFRERNKGQTCISNGAVSGTHCAEVPFPSKKDMIFDDGSYYDFSGNQLKRIFPDTTIQTVHRFPDSISSITLSLNKVFVTTGLSENPSLWLFSSSDNSALKVTEDVVFLNTGLVGVEAQRLFALADPRGADFKYGSSLLWQSDGTVEGTYQLFYRSDKEVSLAWLNSILFLLDEQK